MNLKIRMIYLGYNWRLAVRSHISGEQENMVRTAVVSQQPSMYMFLALILNTMGVLSLNGSTQKAEAVNLKPGLF